MSAVEDYLAKVSPAQRAELERVRQIVSQLAPEAEEVISYGIPTFKLNQRPLIYYAAFKNHMSLFPGAPLKLKEKLKDFKLAKGTIQFTVDHPIPAATLKEIVRDRLADIRKS